MFCDLISVTSSCIVIKIVSGVCWQGIFLFFFVHFNCMKEIISVPKPGYFFLLGFSPTHFFFKNLYSKIDFCRARNFFFFFFLIFCFQTCTTSWPLLQKCNDVINAKSICRLGWQPGNGKVSDTGLAIHLKPSFLLGVQQSNST